MKQVLIIGSNPLKSSIIEQYLSIGVEGIKECGFNDMRVSDVNEVDELVLLTSPSNGSPIAEDNAALEKLTMVAKEYSNPDGHRPVVHLLLQSQTSLWMLQTMDLPSEINEKFDVYPFTVEDVWAKNLLVQIPGIKNAHYPTLDRTPITKDGDNYVHIVISGLNSQAEAIAIHAALTAHYPNYRPEAQLPLRTRITIVEEGIKTKRDTFIARYQHLFDNSYYRTIDLNTRKIDFHSPMYKGSREDFVDVEWEFVDGTINHPEVCKKIDRWATDRQQQLTFFICHDDDERNLSECIALPRCIYGNGIPVMVQQRQKGIDDALRRSTLYENVLPFGMRDCGYDITLPLVQLAKYLKYFYDCSYGNIGVPTELPLEQVEQAWSDEKSFKMRFSNIYNVMTIATKMRSLGHDAEDADTFYALTQEEIEILAETEHNRWSVERLIQGVRPCTDDEIAEIRTDVKTLKKIYKKKDIHFDLRAFSELEEDGTGKNAQVYDYDLTACIPLIVKTFYEENAHGK